MTETLVQGDVVWEGPEELRPFLVPIASLRNHPQNPRRGDVDIIADSLGFFGQLKNIIVHTYAEQTEPWVVAGNHTMRGALQRGWTHIAIVSPKISDDDADEFLLMDNAAADKAVNDDELLAPMLQKLMDSGRLERAGYTPDDVDDMLSRLDAVATVKEEEFKGDYAESPEETKARFTEPGEGVRMKEALLMYPEEQFEVFTGMMRKLREEWGIESARAIVFEALRRCTGGEVVAAPESEAMPSADGEAEA